MLYFFNFGEGEEVRKKNENGVVSNIGLHKVGELRTLYKL